MKCAYFKFLISKAFIDSFPFLYKSREKQNREQLMVVNIACNLDLNYNVTTERPECK